MYCRRIAEFHREQLLFIDESEKFWFITILGELAMTHDDTCRQEMSKFLYKYLPKVKYSCNINDSKASY